MNAKKVTAIYPGTFDPITNGHADIISRASKIVDNLIIAISQSDHKKPMFSVEKRVEMAKIYLANCGINRNVQVHSFSGLLVNFATKIGANILVRGLRVVSDFEYEFQMACMNSRLHERIETIFLPASEKNQFISSRLVKEIASLGGDVSSFVIPEIEQEVLALYKRQ